MFRGFYLAIALISVATATSAQDIDKLIQNCSSALIKGADGDVIAMARAIRGNRLSRHQPYAGQAARCLQRAEELNREQVDDRTYKACSELYHQDATAGILHPVCNDVFRRLGMPID